MKSHLLLAILALPILSCHQAAEPVEPTVEAVEPKVEAVEPTVEAVESKVEAVELFDGTSLDDWKIVDSGGSGDVTLDADEKVLRIGQGEGLSGLVYQKTANLDFKRYEVTLEAKREAGVDFFCGLTFPIGDAETCATFLMGGWGGSVTGISSIDGNDAANNATGTYQRYADDRWYKVRLRVTPERLSAWVDDKEVVDIEIKGRQVSVRPGGIESYLPLSLTTYNTAAAIRHVTFTPLPPVKEE